MVTVLTLFFLYNYNLHFFRIVETRKYPLRGYILGVLTHTTALDQPGGGDGTLTMWF